MYRCLRIGLIILAGLMSFACGGSEDRVEESAEEVPGEVDRTIPLNLVETPNEDGVVISHSISLHSHPGYDADFKHFDYVNSNAPKGGTLVLAGTGTFDNFNRFASRGNSAPMSLTAFYDTLLMQSLDEIEVYYGLIAEKVEYTVDYDWIIFHLNPKARYQDGSPIVADDVVFSFNKFMKEGVSQVRTYYKTVSAVTALDERRVKFSLSEPSKELLVSLGKLEILPPQYWEDRDFSEPIAEPPLGSGAYRVADYSMGQYVRYERLKDYWAMDIPSIRGTLNFDYIRYDMYRDETVKLEALKAGKVDFRMENVVKQWVTQYTGSNFDAGYIVKEDIPHEIHPSIQSSVFNTERSFFSDRRVRKAIGLMFDFEWLNNNLFYNRYRRIRSYFQSRPFEALGLPSEEEVAILEPIRDKIPEEIFTTEYQPPRTDGSGNMRAQIQEALDLFSEAGWEIRDRVLVNRDSGEPFEFEMLIYTPSSERVAIPFQENLKKIGIAMSIRLVDTSQYVNRARERDYDMRTTHFIIGYYPDSDLNVYWHSDYLDSTYNFAGVQDESIDYLVEGILAHQDDNEMLAYWSRALDRVLQWRYYTIPEWYNSNFSVAYWDKFGRPEKHPKYDLGLGTWWLDEARYSRLPDTYSRQ